MLELGTKIFSLYPFESHGKESNAVNAGLMLVPRDDFTINKIARNTHAGTHVHPCTTLARTERSK